jgi:hypothetical protein
MEKLLKAVRKFADANELDIIVPSVEIYGDQDITLIIIDTENKRVFAGTQETYNDYLKSE